MSSAFKKELMFFSRTYRMFGVIFSILIFSLFDPLLMKGMQELVNTISTMSAGEELISETVSMFPEFSSMEVFAMNLNDLCSTAPIIIMLLLMQTCGGEQKKRSIIIPQCAGLTPIMYVVPKFVIYPAVVLLCSTAAAPLGSVFSMLLFGGEINVGNAVLAGMIVGIYLLFLVVLELMIGICAERPGLSALIVILLAALMPNLLTMLSLGGNDFNKFNPFALPAIALQVMSGNADAFNAAVSIGVTVVVCAILFFSTLFVLTAKKVENEGSEPLL